MIDRRDPLVGVVVSTVGRHTDELRSLLVSLCAQTSDDLVVGICDQSTGRDIALMVEEFADRLDIFCCGSAARGLSAGRNAVIDRMPDEARLLIFPNDTSRLQADLVATLLGRYLKFDITVMRYLEGTVPRYALEPPGTPMNRWNLWLIPESGMALSAEFVRTVGPFDESLGTGAASPWQSGEGSDLLLRGLPTSPLVAWAHDLTVHGVEQEYGLSTAQRRRKLRRYGRGFGFVRKRWGYTRPEFSLSLIAPIARGVLRLSAGRILDGVATSLGRVEGWRGARRNGR